MGTKQLLVGVLVLCLVTAAQGFTVGTINGAGYFFGGPASTNSHSASIGTGLNGASAYQSATADNPGGVGLVVQGAGASGGQLSFPGFQAQGMIAGMGQATIKAGGSGYVTGTQSGTVGMTQNSPGGSQSSYVTGMQTSGSYGYGGLATTSQTMVVSTGQVQIH